MFYSLSKQLTAIKVVTVNKVVSVDNGLYRDSPLFLCANGGSGGRGGYMYILHSTCHVWLAFFLYLLYISGKLESPSILLLKCELARRMHKC